MKDTTKIRGQEYQLTHHDVLDPKYAVSTLTRVLESIPINFLLSRYVAESSDKAYVGVLNAHIYPQTIPMNNPKPKKLNIRIKPVDNLFLRAEITNPSQLEQETLSTHQAVLSFKKHRIFIQYRNQLF